MLVLGLNQIWWKKYKSVVVLARSLNRGDCGKSIVSLEFERFIIQIFTFNSKLYFASIIVFCDLYAPILPYVKSTDMSSCTRAFENNVHVGIYR